MDHSFTAWSSPKGPSPFVFVLEGDSWSVCSGSSTAAASVKGETFCCLSRDCPSDASSSSSEFSAVSANFFPPKRGEVVGKMADSATDAIRLCEKVLGEAASFINVGVESELSVDAVLGRAPFLVMVRVLTFIGIAVPLIPEVVGGAAIPSLETGILRTIGPRKLEETVGGEDSAGTNRFMSI